MSDKASFMVHVDSKVMKVGNSVAIILPKVIIDNYQIKQGEILRLYLHELGIIIEKPMQEVIDIIPQDQMFRSPVAP